MNTSSRAGFKLCAAAVSCVLLAATASAIFKLSVPVAAENTSCAAESPARLARTLARGDVAALQLREEPSKLPDFSFAGADGAKQTIRDFKGKTVLLNLWASWCAPCRAEMPALDRLQKQRGGADFTVLALSLDSGLAAPQAFYKDNRIENLTLYLDSATEGFRALRKAGLASGLPTTLLLDKENCVWGVLVGPADWAGQDAARLLDAALPSSRYRQP